MRPFGFHVVLALLLLYPAALFAQSQGTNCTATILNRSVAIEADGRISIPNVPFQPGYFRVRVTCTADGATTFGQSAYVFLSTNGPTFIGPITYGALAPLPTALSISAPNTNLTAAAEAVQLTATLVFANGSIATANSPSQGTLWSSSNPRIAMVSSNGVVTAVSRGAAIITALNEGVQAAFTVRVSIPEDADRDGLPDAYEQAAGLNSQQAADAGQDADGDGLTNLEEYQAGTDPKLGDTDRDGLFDGEELRRRTNPLQADTDHDGLNDGEEVERGFNPLSADTDGDGILDGVELRLGLNPLVADSITTVRGTVIGTNGTPEADAAVTVLGMTAKTDTAGYFSLPNVPAGLGPISAKAQIILAGQVFDGTSSETFPVPGGVTQSGVIEVRLNSGNIVGTVRDPVNLLVADALVEVGNGTDTRTALTDTNGLFRVTNMTAGEFKVTVRDPKTGLRGRTVGVLSLNQSATANVTLGAFGTVAGTVYDANGRPVMRPVEVQMSGALTETITTDHKGKFRFEFVPLGGYSLEAEDESGAPAKSRGNISATSQVLISDLSFLARGAVRGVVLDAALNAVSNAAVELVTPELSRYLTSSDGAGRYHFSNVFAGPFFLNARSPSTGLSGNQNGRIDTEGQLVNKDVILGGAGSITGIVYRAGTMTAITGAVVSVWDEIRRNPRGQEVTTDAHGAYLVNFIPLGQHIIVVKDAATGDDGQTNVILSVQGEALYRELRTLGQGSVSVTVVSASNVPLSGVEVRLLNGNSRIATTATGGTVQFDRVQAGFYSVSATDPSTSLSSGETIGRMIPGSNAVVTVRLQPSGSIRGTVFAGTNPVPNIRVALDGSSKAQIVTTGGDGTYRFDNVPLRAGLAVIALSDRNTLIGRSSPFDLSALGQEVVADFSIGAFGFGTVTGIVRSVNGTVAPGASVIVQSFVAGTDIQQVNTDVRGAYAFTNVPIGRFGILAVSSGQQGAVFGDIASNGQTVGVNVNMGTNSVFLPSTLYDANNFSYDINPDGSVLDGSFFVFSGDGAAQRGAGLLDVVRAGVTNRFAGRPVAQSDATGREFQITQSGVAGVEVTRKVFVPSAGYFVRYLDVFSNSTPETIVFDVRLTSHYRARRGTISGLPFLREPRLFATSSGDAVLSPTGDGWAAIDDDLDTDPFLEVGQPLLISPPATAHVFGGTGAAQAIASADFLVESNLVSARLIERWTNVVVAPGSNVAFLHFLVEQVNRTGAVASAERLRLLPPEALVGLTTDELANIRNFAVPSNGFSILPPLPALTGTVMGSIFATGPSNSLLLPNARVRFHSTNPIYGRTHEFSGSGAGQFSFSGKLANNGASVPVPIDGFDLTGFVPRTRATSPPNFGAFNSGFNVTTQNVLFPGVGNLGGTVRRHNDVVVSGGSVDIAGEPLDNRISTGVLPNGNYAESGLPADIYTLMATTPTAGSSSLAGFASAPIAPGELTMRDIFIQETGNLTGRVRRENGSPVFNVRVELYATNYYRAVTTDTGGNFAFNDVPSGPVTMRGFDQATQSGFDGSAIVVTDQTTHREETLLSTGRVRGRVVNSDYTPAAGVSLTLMTFQVVKAAGVTDADGRFEFEEVPILGAGIDAVYVFATKTGTELHGEATGELRYFGHVIDLQIQLHVRGGLTGTIYRPDGLTPAAGTQVKVSHRGRLPVFEATVTTDSQGRYSVTNIPASVIVYSVSASNALNGEFAAVGAQVNSSGVVTQNLNLNATFTAGNVAIREGNRGSTNAMFEARLSWPSMDEVSVWFRTSNRTATAVSDYLPMSGILTFPPLVGTQLVTVPVYGDLLAEGDETFSLQLTDLGQNILFSEGVAMITNDDGIAGELDHFEFFPIPSPQIAGRSFVVSIVAKDSFGTTVTNFTGPVSLGASLGPAIGTTNWIVNFDGFGGGSANVTRGYSFTPQTNILVTHIRHNGTSRISFYTPGGILISEQSVTNTHYLPAETPLNVPVLLRAGVSYRVAVHNFDGFTESNFTPPVFTDGTVDGSFFAYNDAYPQLPAGDSWPAIGLKYTTATGAVRPFNPMASGTFTNGLWSGSVAMPAPGESILLRAEEAGGHVGVANLFDVVRTNDLVLNMAGSPDLPAVGGSIVYQLKLTNTGPSSAVGVAVTNLLPDGVDLISATSSLGTCTTTGRLVTCSLLILPSGVDVTVTMTVRANIPGLLTNVAGASRSGTDADVSNNIAQIVTPVSLPSLSIANITVAEGNVGTREGEFSVRLSQPSIVPIHVFYGVNDGTALRPDDYIPAGDGEVIFAPGETNRPLTFRVFGNTAIEPDKTFSVTLVPPTNAVLASGFATGTITNDDGLNGVIDHFDWAPIPSPQIVGEAFPITLTAKDAAGHTVTNYVGPMAFRSSRTNMIIGDLYNPSGGGNDSLSLTVGYSLTPNTNIIVTHLRAFFGDSVSLWTDVGELLATVAFNGSQGTWTEGALDTPVALKPYTRYRISAKKLPGLAQYWSTNLAPTFADGVIHGGHYRYGDGFPDSLEDQRIYFVDLKYIVGTYQDALVTPLSVGLFTNGVWSSNIVVRSLATNLVLRADDGGGHRGLANPINVIFRNDLMLGVTDSPDPAPAGSEVSYSLLVSNTGPTTATAVVVTNLIPADVELISVSVSHGTSVLDGQTVRWAIGSVAPGTNAMATVVVRPFYSGTLINRAGVSRGESDAFAGNNYVETTTTVSLPTITVSDASVGEGNVGTSELAFQLRLSSPNAFGASVQFNVANGTALDGQDFVATNGFVNFLPGETNQTVSVIVRGDIQAESNETLLLQLSGASGATLIRTQAVGIILNDDGLPGSVDHFDFAQISSPQQVAVPFPVTIIAKDPAGATVSNFDGTVVLSASSAGERITNVILGNLTHSGFGSGVVSVGYSFTPNTNMLVTHVRSYSGTNVSIWTDTGTLLAKQTINAPEGAWTETPLGTNITLLAGVRYRVSVHTRSRFYSQSAPPVYAYGTIDEAYTSGGDAFPTNITGTKWFLVDLKYTVPGAEVAVPISPTFSGTFTNGVWNGAMSVLAPANDTVLLRAYDDGHAGLANPFFVAVTNDLSVRITASPSVADVQSNLTYTITVSNSGPLASTSVVLTNLLPLEVNHISSTASQGVVTNLGRFVSCNLGTLPGQSSATVTIVVKPTLDEIFLTNTVAVRRAEAEIFAGNNVAAISTQVRTLFDRTAKVAIYGAPSFSGYNLDIREKILSAGVFSQVDVHLVTSGNPVPTLSELSQYAAVFVYSDAGFNDGTSLGNVLADYVDGGGGVVVAPMALGFTPFVDTPLHGRFYQDGYLPFTDYGALRQNTPLFMVKDDARHLILEGVNNFSGGGNSAHDAFLTLRSNATLVAHWNNGEPLVATHQMPRGRVAALNFYPPSSDASAQFWSATTDGGKLMANALAWSSRRNVTLPNDVAVTSAADSEVQIGTSITYSMDVTNSGPVAASGVILSNMLAPGAAVISVTASRGVINTNIPGFVICDLGTMASGEHVAIQIVARAFTSVSVTNVAVLSRLGQDAYLGNNRTTNVTRVAVPEISVVDASVVEGDSGTTNAVFQVRLSFPSPEPVSIEFQAVPSTESINDFEPTNATLVFQPGETNRTVTVKVFGDLRNEGDENFYVLFYEPTNAFTPFDLVAVGTIVNDDPEPAISIQDATVVEGNIGLRQLQFAVTLSRPSGFFVSAEAEIAGVTAQLGSDFAVLSEGVSFGPGQTSAVFSVTIFPDTQIEPNETVSVSLMFPFHATLDRSEAVGTIVNDDGLAGQVHHFAFSAIPSPQSVNNAFGVSITAKDATGATVTGFNGAVNLLALSGAAPSNAPPSETLIGDQVPTDSEFGDYTIGYLFTPLTNVIVTHVRHYSASRISIWTAEGRRLAYQSVSGPSGVWSETPLDHPVALRAGSAYFVTLYSAANTFYVTHDVMEDGAHVRILPGMAFAYGDAMPNYIQEPGSEYKLALVDLRFVVGEHAEYVAVSPAVAGPFVNGVWNGTATVHAPVTNVMMVADDRAGHTGIANGFESRLYNDVAITSGAAPNPVPLNSNVIYRIVARNSGPAPAHDVMVAVILPELLTLDSFISSQGTATRDGDLLTWNAGTLASGASAALTLLATAPIETLLTNVVVVTRSGADNYLPNNTTTNVVKVTGGTAGYYTDYNSDYVGPQMALMMNALSAVQITNLLTANFAGFSFLFLDVGGSPSFELLQRVSDLDSWVRSGGKLIVHKDFMQPGVSDALLFGFPDARSMYWFDFQAGVIPPPSPVVSGPFGAFDSSAISDLFINVYISGQTLMTNAHRFMGVGGNTNNVIAFEYPLERGFVYFSTIRLQDYLEGFSTSDLQDVLTNTYAPNVVSYMKALTPTPAMLPPGGAFFVVAPGATGFTNGGFKLRVDGLSGQSPVVISASTNLVHWDAIFTNPPTSRTLEYFDLSATNRSRRFYRIEEQ